MRPIILLSLFLLLLPFVVYGASFPGTWGESEAVVRQQTGAGAGRIIDGKGLKALFVNDRMAGLEAFAIYLLAEDKLVQTKYLFAQNYTNGGQFLDDFTRVDAILREKYGQPVESGEFWRDRPRNTADRSEWIRMIAIGQLVIMSRWETEETVITHVLDGENLDIDHEINYVSKKLGPAGGKGAGKISPSKEFRF